LNRKSLGEAGNLDSNNRVALDRQCLVDCRRGGVGGRALSPASKPFLDRVPIATRFDSNIVNGKIAGANSRPEHILEVCDASLERLGAGVIDPLHIAYRARLDCSNQDCRHRRITYDSKQ
jgi:hypothetical protein